MSSIDQLDDLIAELEHDIEVQAIRLDLAKQLRATYALERAVADLATPEPPATRRAPKAKAAKVRCPECDEMFHPNGMGPHRRAKHPKSVDRDRDAAEAVASLIVPADEKRYFICTTCEARAETREALAKHTDTNHHRGLKGEEHFARGAA